MNLERDDFFVSTDSELLDIEFVCRSLNRTPWARNRPRAVIEESIRNSVCFGVYNKEDRKQIGFARVVTDKATFSWVCDLFINEKHRKQELEKWLKACIAAHPSVKHDAANFEKGPAGSDLKVDRAGKTTPVVTLSAAERDFLTS